MMQAITTAADSGMSDEKILELLAANYGKNILLTPTFRGFDTLLWIVPVSVLVVAIGGTLAVQKRKMPGNKQPS